MNCGGWPGPCRPSRHRWASKKEVAAHELADEPFLSREVGSGPCQLGGLPSTRGGKGIGSLRVIARLGTSTASRRGQGRRRSVYPLVASRGDGVESRGAHKPENQGLPCPVTSISSATGGGRFLPYAARCWISHCRTQPAGKGQSTLSSQGASGQSALGCAPPKFFFHCLPTPWFRHRKSPSQGFWSIGISSLDISDGFSLYKGQIISNEGRQRESSWDGVSVSPDASPSILPGFGRQRARPRILFFHQTSIICIHL